MDNNILQLVIRVRDEASAQLKNLSGQVSDVSNKIKLDFKSAGLVAGAASGAIALFTKSAVENAASYEQNRIAFEAMLGSAEKARNLLSQVSDFAQKTPFELPQVVEGSKRLLAYNIEAQKIIPTFQMLGDISAGVGTDKLPQLITAFGQVAAKGKLMGQELLQFTEAGVGLGQVLQKQFNVSRDELEKMVSTGKIGFSDVEKALQTMTSQGGLFFEGMERQSKSFNGVMSNINDAFGKFVREIVGINDKGDIREGSLFAALKKGAESFLVILETVRPQITGFVNMLSENTPLVLAIAGAIGGLFVAALVAAVIAVGGLIAASLPVIAIFMAIGVAIGLLIAFWPQISAFFINIGNIVSTTLTNISVWWNQTWTGITSFVQQAIDTILQIFNFAFSLSIPFIIGFLIGFLMTAVPSLINDISSWFSQLPGRISAVWESVKTATINKISETVSWLASQLSALPSKIQAWISSVPGIASGIFESAKQAVINKMTEMFEGVKGWWDKIMGILNGIRDAANAAFDAVMRGLNAGKKVGSFAIGGFVPSTGLAMVHAGEFVLSRDMLAGNQSVPEDISRVFNQPITINAQINSDTDIDLIGYRLAWFMRNSR